MHLNEIGIVSLTELGWDLIRCLAVVLALLSDGGSDTRQFLSLDLAFSL
jgi:hypothetical protein